MAGTQHSTAVGVFRPTDSNAAVAAVGPDCASGKSRPSAAISPNSPVADICYHAYANLFFHDFSIAIVPNPHSPKAMAKGSSFLPVVMVIDTAPDAAERMTAKSLKDSQAEARKLDVGFMYVSQTNAISTVVPDDRT